MKIGCAFAFFQDFLVGSLKEAIANVIPTKGNGKKLLGLMTREGKLIGQLLAKKPRLFISFSKNQCIKNIYQKEKHRETLEINVRCVLFFSNTVIWQYHGPITFLDFFSDIVPVNSMLEVFQRKFVLKITSTFFG